MIGDTCVTAIIWDVAWRLHNSSKHFVPAATRQKNEDSITTPRQGQQQQQQLCMCVCVCTCLPLLLPILHAFYMGGCVRSLFERTGH